MAYRIQIHQIGKTGVPKARLALYEADTELDAIALATYEVDIGRSAPQRIATMFDPSGLLVLAYVGRARVLVGDGAR